MSITKAVFGSVAALLVSATLSAPAMSQQLRDVKISLMALPEVAPVYAAIKQGYFEEEGLKVETVPSTGGAAAIPGLIGGSFQFAYGNIVSNVLAVDKGLDIKVIGGTTRAAERKSDIGIMVKSASPIASGADLEGKTMSVNTRNNVIWVLARGWIRATGGDPDKVNFKEVPFPQAQDAVLNDQVDAAFIVSPFYEVALENGLKGIGDPYKLIQPKIQVGQYSTTGALIENEPEMVNGFLRALAKGNAWYDAHIGKPELRDLISEYTGMSKENVAKLELSPALDGVSRDEFQKTLSLMINEGIVTAPITADQILYQPK